MAWSQFDGPLFDIAGANQRVKEFSTFERLLFLGESSKGQVKDRLLDNTALSPWFMTRKAT